MKADIKKATLRRLRIIAGQVKGLERMVEGEKYCVDVITQASAIKEALSGVEDLVLKNHLETHVLHAMKAGKGGKAIAEVLKVYKLAQYKN
ncbi:hypothetical protein A3A39_01005 [Candidatus Kaiserbacteria bacterium RIFCSPLOWO2_01_FULL_54_13]|uniref:Transcriptional regulator n=1 Tax=Candidatus Kaiserbacteria bacterium RIFCSPLOWO2_01_FULL_54_13 TaxID=1798512 RepID=A0A1F6F253_9BACT|nr:MAG: hypothetical protein A3A39_01005 [Candidatus Kaiserbacteria bacterium RIFCSPLOWO2_01_FULL_54_13]